MSEPAIFPADTLHELALRVVRGDAVFFIGSGFSIDSEKNSTPRLIGRLLIRLLALTHVLEARGHGDATDVITRFSGTFDIDEKEQEAGRLFPFTKAQVEKLGNRYYETNDWFCVAFARLLEIISRTRPKAKWQNVLDAVAAREEEIRLETLTYEEKVINDAVSLDGIDLRLVAAAKEAVGKDAEKARMAGKALFLDTMGFRDPRIMCGEPTLADPKAAMDSYDDRLLPRHHVIARFAREGFCSTTITPNFDRLLEGAFRVAGFTMVCPEKTPDQTETFSPPTHIDHFVRIASPDEFYSHGKAHRSAILVKMHGCAERYHDLRGGDFGAVTKYLRSMVFTYREIQNWRQDWWAADYLRTLLRTRTVVFCGYSVQDPVIHDTFRTVYEDMAKFAEEGKDKSKKADAAPAFFLAPGDTTRSEFHGTEVLHAASRAFRTCDPPFSDHPNYLRFNYRGKPEFPDIDEQLQWLEHDVFRQRQQECLEAFLYRSVSGLLGGPQPEEDLNKVRQAFTDLVRSERKLAGEWKDSVVARREHAALCGWTSQFHSGLLRELAAIEMVQSQHGPSAALSRMRQIPWYYPTTAAGGWTCWGVVVELALRNMVDAAWGGATPNPPRPLIRAGVSIAPTVLIAPPPADDAFDLEAPVALTICFRGLGRRGDDPKIFGSPVRNVWWELSQQDIPWPVDRRNTGEESDAPPPFKRTAAGSNQNRRLRAPDAALMWHWAIARRPMTPELLTCLGLRELP